MNKKALFKKFSEENGKLLPFCMHYNWWNEVVVDDWDVAILSNQNQVSAIMPYYIRKKGLWKIITNPHFTPYCGPFLNYPEGQKTSSKISFEHKSYDALIEQIPEVAEFGQHFYTDFKNGLPFLWNDFSVSNKYTFLLDLDNDAEALFSNFRENTRRQIKKAEKSLKVEESNDASLLETMLKATYEQQTDNYPGFESIWFERILDYCKKYNCGKLWRAHDAEDDHSVLLSIWDHNTAYYLIGGSASKHKNSGAMSLLMWEAIQNAKALRKEFFNFEGSSVKPIEQFLRGFGGELQTFCRVTKSNSSSLQLAKKLKG